MGSYRVYSQAGMASFQKFSWAFRDLTQQSTAASPKNDQGLGLLMVIFWGQQYGDQPYPALQKWLWITAFHGHHFGSGVQDGDPLIMVTTWSQRPLAF